MNSNIFIGDLMKFYHFVRIKAFPQLIKMDHPHSIQPVSHAPESLFRTSSKEWAYQASDDVWAVGCLISEIITGYRMLYDDSPPAIQ